MRISLALAIGAVLLLAGAGSAPAQTTAFADEAPWISIALAHADELGLTARQVGGLGALREGFRREAERLGAEIRAVEDEIRSLYARMSPDLAALEARVRTGAGLRADLRLARMKVLALAGDFLTAEQRVRLGELARTTGGMHGASMHGAPGGDAEPR